MAGGLGRYSRRQFLGQLAVALLWTGGIVFLAIWADEARKQGAGIAGFIIYLIFCTRAAVGRLHDLGWSGWWLITLVPIPLLFIIPGSRGDNKYGPDPRGR